MEILATSSSVKTHLVLETSKTSLKDLLRLTLLDLLMKRVLELRIMEIQHHPQDPVYKDYYVVAGANFKGYRYQAHERFFLQAFIQNNSRHVVLRHLIKTGIKGAKNEKTFIYKYIRKCPILQNKFKGSLVYNLWGVTRLNEDGQELQARMRTEIQELELSLPKLLLRDPKQAMEVLLKIKANLFLLRNASTTIIEGIKPEFFIEIKRKAKEEAIDFGEETYFWDLLTIYRRFVYDFDRTFDSVEDVMGREDSLSGHVAGGFLEVLLLGIWGGS